MRPQGRLDNTRRYLRSHWPAFFGLYGLLVLTVVLLGVGLASGWYALIPFALAVMLVAGYVLAGALWTAYQTYDGPGPQIIAQLIDYAQLRPDDKIVCIDLGLRATAVEVARRLITGQVTTIDVYNPQSNPGAPLRRARAAARKPGPDPRLEWIDGRIELLPMPDQSVRLVFMNEVLSEFWLPEERARLLEEVRRILVPGGRLLLAERHRTRTNLLFSGLATSTLPPAETWHALLLRADFRIEREDSLRGLVYCARADRPPPTEGRQLRLHLEFL
ncbi:MAG: class I SAM-dependent methyltransferase [Anaerolineae bacterium]|nr:class I SAM-dependent methyltransferase [Anaerolineae bacterium]